MRILITAGGTREYIDPVRFISNASSGRMGHALVCAALKAGHKVTLITTPAQQPAPSAAKIVKVHSAAEMLEAVQKRFTRCDCLIMAAAVADYTPAYPAKTKIKRTRRPLSIKLKPTVDILKWAGKHKKNNQVVVGFALEDRNVRARAEKKLKEKNLDMIIANTPAAIGASKSTVQIKTPDSPWIKIENATKITTATRIISLVQNL
jgi:phosphopantothenoylcysteine decarboxylase/phosphopantothenate--cysteine ligase